MRAEVRVLEQPEITRPMAAEVQLLVASIDDAHHRRYIAGLVSTGMRAYEATAVRIEDVDLAHCTIHVRRAFSIGVDGRGIELTPKSHEEHDVPIRTRLVGPLTEAMAGKRRGDLVLTVPRGGRINASNVRRAIDWKTVRAQPHRDERRIHDLQHTLPFDAGALPTTCRRSSATRACR